jgi:glycosyltransferase involved in cell wall biosynthesis
MTGLPGVAIVCTYPPRQCGLAVFSRHLLDSLRALGEDREADGGRLQVVAVDSGEQDGDYPPEVRFRIGAHSRADYREAAWFLNASCAEVVSLQHEYGIFGGRDGDFVIHLLRGLKKPVVTTLHTVLERPAPGQRLTLKTVCALSSVVVAQADGAVDVLVDVFDVLRGKIVVVPHGAPDVPLLDSAFHKRSIGAEGRRVVLTFGLLSPNKGIEYAIEAVARLVDEFPDLLYVVVGATHPEVKKRHGERYRFSLERLVREKGLQSNVVFHNRFVSDEELMGYLLSADIYLTPYLAEEQIVSGTLAHAVACGKAVVSTPYRYAREVLAEGRGVLVPFRDPAAVAEGLRPLLADPVLRERMGRNAYTFGRRMTWPVVARAYAQVFGDAFRAHAALRRPGPAGP